LHFHAVGAVRKTAAFRHVCPDIRPAHPAGLRNPGRTKTSQSGLTARPARDKVGQWKPYSNALLRNLLHFFMFLCMDLSFLTAPAEHSLHAWTDLRPVLPDLVSVLPDLQIRRQPQPRHLSRPCQTPERLLFRYPITSPDSEGNFLFGSAIHLRGQNAVQMHRRPVGVEGGRKKCPPSTRIGPLHARMPFGPRRWIAELPVPADMEIRMICANRRPQRRTTKTWKRYVLRNRPCGGLCDRLSGTYCTQVATKTPTRERHSFRADFQSTF